MRIVIEEDEENKRKSTKKTKEKERKRIGWGSEERSGEKIRGRNIPQLEIFPASYFF